MRGLRWLLLAGALCSAQAQAQDLAAYRTLAQALDRAAETVATDRGAAQADLNRARGALTALLPTLPGGLDGQVSRSLRATVTQAESALTRTPAEVQANILIARGLMRRTLYDQVMAGLQAQTSSANDGAGLQLLGREMGFNQSSLDSLRAQARAGQLETIGWRMRRVASSKVTSALGAVTPTQSQTNNYLNLTRASSWFSLVREEGRAATPPLTVAQFEQALRHVTTGDQNALQKEVGTMQAAAADIGRRLAATSQDTPTPAQTTGTATEAGKAPNTSSGQSGAVQGGVVARPTALTSLDAIYAALARALNASGHGDPAHARQEISQAVSLMGSTSQALRRTPAFAQAQRDALALQYRTGVRPDDIQSLMATLGSAEAQLAGRAVAGSDGFSATISRTLGGWVRMLLALALAALCLLPLRFLNLAFGGSNIYWRSISAGLLILLLPMLLEGVFGLLGWVGDLLGVPLLRGAVNLTLSQGTGGLLVYGLLSAVGLGLLAYGFQGLCRQFGLLGRRVTTSSPRPPSRYTQTGLDWEEEL